MECPTYKLLLVNSKSAICESEMEEIKTILADISDEDYFITIVYTPYNPTCHYTTSIIILRKSYEEAEPISSKIKTLLENHNIRAERCETTLLWNEPAVYLKIR